MSALPLSCMACGVTIVTELVTVICDSLMGTVLKGQEKTDLEVRISDWQKDVTSVIKLELGFGRMSHCSVCQSVSAHQTSSYTLFCK